MNEEGTIEKVLKNVKKYVDEIILIDDGSTDNTKKIAKKYATIISNKENVGYSNSLNKGFELATKKEFDVIITLDADGQHLPSDIPKMTKPVIQGKADIVVGRRPYKARLMESVFAIFGRKRGVHDPLCGMKAYSHEVYERFGFFDNINSIGTQLTFAALKQGFRVQEKNIKLKRREDVPRFGRKIKANFKLLLAYIRLIRYLKGDTHGNRD